MNTRMSSLTQFTAEQEGDICNYSLNTQKTADLFKFKAGDSLLIVGSANTPFHQFERVTVTKDTEDGIFESLPYVTVQGDNTDRPVWWEDRPYCLHAQRFVPANVLDIIAQKETTP